MTSGGGQGEVLGFLADPRTYGSADIDVERIDTHCSVIFLAGDRAYKMKRAVAFSYLDYSTVDLRRQACEAELKLNRRTAPSLYLEVRAVRRGAGGLTFDGSGEIADWVLVMRRFDQEALFDRMAARDALTPALMRELADRVVDFHAGAEIDHREGGRQGLLWVVESNIVNLRSDPSGTIPPEFVDRLERGSLAAVDEFGGLLDDRRAFGRVRLCHGDLHLRNICLVDGRPTLFDGIEFSRAVACIDVLYDLAFLLMDLEQHARRDLANAVFNRYLDRTDESGGLPALPLFLSARAAIRAHTTLAAAERQASGADRQRLRVEARACFDLAAAFLHPCPPCLIAIGGLSGSGKTTLAHGLAPDVGRSPGARVLRSDVIRKRLYGVAPETRLDQSAYTPALNSRVYEVLGSEAATSLEAGQAVIADAVFARISEREAIRAVAADAGVPFFGFWLDASPAVLLQRVGRRHDDASDATPAVVEQQLSYDLGPIVWCRLDAARGSDEKLEEVRKVLAALL